ncbi:UNKNOWN [Stylonychia lemnae]|uniref:Uncharacterized protein n=1 Tax=Stylonychia lemnae TaxID=5949 RepID=A0A078BAN5_STYLE|nr:UNKNOWN [Stylonychia lemnae]|eukprot:CDW91286.1 UNKNOWN [Stylonychia lemnae]
MDIIDPAVQKYQNLLLSLGSGGLQTLQVIYRKSTKQKYQKFIDSITKQMKTGNQQLHIEEVYTTNNVQETIISVNLVSLYRNFMIELKKANVNNSGNEEQKEEKKNINAKKIPQKQKVKEQNELKNQVNIKDQKIRFQAEEEKQIPRQNVENVANQLPSPQKNSNRINELKNELNQQDNAQLNGNHFFQDQKSYLDQFFIENYNFDSLYQWENKIEPCLKCSNNLQKVEELQEEIQVMRYKELENAEIINKKDQLNLELQKQLEDLQIRLRELEERELEDQILPSIRQGLDKQPRQRQDQIYQQQSAMKVAKIAQQQKVYQKDSQSENDLESQNSDWDFKMPKVDPKLDLVSGKYGKQDIYKKTPQDQFLTDDYDVTRNLQPRLANIVSSYKKQLSRYICRNKKQVQMVKDCLKEFKMQNQESGKLIKKDTRQANIIDGQYRGQFTIFTFTNK